MVLEMVFGVVFGVVFGFWMVFEWFLIINRFGAF